TSPASRPSTTTASETTPTTTVPLNPMAVDASRPTKSLRAAGTATGKVVGTTDPTEPKRGTHLERVLFALTAPSAGQTMDRAGQHLGSPQRANTTPQTHPLNHIRPAKERVPLDHRRDPLAGEGMLAATGQSKCAREGCRTGEHERGAGQYRH